jgi:hypothetical protein
MFLEPPKPTLPSANEWLWALKKLLLSPIFECTGQQLLDSGTVIIKPPDKHFKNLDLLGR